MITQPRTAMIVDDEAPLCSYLRRQLKQLWPELAIVADASNGHDALKLFRVHKPDIAFLDIQMPGMTGLELAAHITPDCHIVFVTAYDHYAVQAFEHAAVDYLLKPVTQSRLQQTLSRLRTQLSQKPADISTLLQQFSHSIPSTPQYLQWLKVAHNDQINLLSITDVDYFQASDKYTSVFTAEREWTIRTPLKELETSLDPALFWRIHRSTIVKVNAIARVSRDLAGRYYANIHGYTKPLHISRRYTHLFKQD